MSLLFIRHAETDLAGTFCGHSDPPLNARGHAQAADLRTTLSTQPFDDIYSSDLQRAVQTAAYLPYPIHDGLTVMSGKNHRDPRPNLREIHFGDWESLTWPEIEARDPIYARRWADAFPRLPAPNGEPFAHFESRVLREFDHLLSASADGRIAVVTHAGVLRLILRELFGCSDEDAWQRTAAYCSCFSYPSAETQSPTSPQAPSIHVTMEDTTGATP